eukprot:scaffold141355_cov115-Phaeocystis_antarctica.AAC.2
MARGWNCTPGIGKRCCLGHRVQYLLLEAKALDCGQLEEIAYGQDGLCTERDSGLLGHGQRHYMVERMVHAVQCASSQHGDLVDNDDVSRV